MTDVFKVFYPRQLQRDIWRTSIWQISHLVMSTPQMYDSYPCLYLADRISRFPFFLLRSQQKHNFYYVSTSFVEAAKQTLTVMQGNQCWTEICRGSVSRSTVTAYTCLLLLLWWLLTYSAPDKTPGRILTPTSRMWEPSRTLSGATVSEPSVII